MISGMLSGIELENKYIIYFILGPDVHVNSPLFFILIKKKKKVLIRINNSLILLFFFYHPQTIKMIIPNILYIKIALLNIAKLGNSVIIYTQIPSSGRDIPKLSPIRKSIPVFIEELSGTRNIVIACVRCPSVKPFANNI